MQWSETIQKLPLKMVGGNQFGRYPKISSEETFNMIISDDWLVNFAGYSAVKIIDPTGIGRGIYTSTNFNLMFIVVDNGLYTVNAGLVAQRIASLSTYSGDVFIAENNAGQIGICDKENIYIYVPNSSSFTILTAAVLGFTPGYLTFQDTYFISVGLNTNEWHLSDPSNGLMWNAGLAKNTGRFETEADNPIAVARVPGKGNLLFVFGKKVTEAWYDTGSPLFPYQRNSYFNIDYGCLNAATIAVNNTTVAWLAANDKSGPMIMVSQGQDPQKISTDGIDYVLQSLTNPSDAYGYFFQQDGHLLYVLVFPTDKVSYAYDFNTQKFFTLTDQNMNNFIAKRVTRFNDVYYFVSTIDGKLYALGTQYSDYDGYEIPRVRVLRNIRMTDSSRFIIANTNFTMQQGMSATVPRQTTNTTDPLEQSEYDLQQRIDFTLSKNGSQTFSNAISKVLNAPYVYPNRVNFWRLGAANDFAFQFRFWGFNRFLLTDGEVNYYQ